MKVFLRFAELQIMTGFAAARFAHFAGLSPKTKSRRRYPGLHR